MRCGWEGAYSLIALSYSSIISHIHAILQAMIFKSPHDTQLWTYIPSQAFHFVNAGTANSMSTCCHLYGITEEALARRTKNCLDSINLIF